MHCMPPDRIRLHGLMLVLPAVSHPLPIHYGSHITIDKIRGTKYNAKTKRHIQVRLKSVRGLVFDRTITIEFVGT